MEVDNPPACRIAVEDQGPSADRIRHVGELERDQPDVIEDSDLEVGHLEVQVGRAGASGPDPVKERLVLGLYSRPIAEAFG